MESLSKLHLNQKPIHISLTPFSSPFPKYPSSFSLRSPSSSKRISIKASSSPKPLPSRLLKSTAITITAAAALLFANLQTKPPIAIAITPPPTVESLEESSLEDHLSTHPDDVEALRSLMEVKIKTRKLTESVTIIDRLIELEPTEREWPILKANIFTHTGDLHSAKTAFEDILSKDPLRVEAYHGLVMSCSGDDLATVEKRIHEAMKECKDVKDLRDFKLLVAQIRVIEGKHEEALELYEELVKEEPRDFRPYLCQGIIYTVLKKEGEAEKKFDKFRRLVPKNHPYREYFMDNMVATKVFAEKAQREMAGSKS